MKELSVQLAESLAGYTQEAAEEIGELAEEVAGECVERLKKTSPRKTGKYAKSWTSETAHRSREETRVVVKNKQAYKTHLLENGHAKRGGKGRVEGIPHIAPAEREAVQKFETGVQKILAGH